MAGQLHEHNIIGENLTRDQIEELQQFGALEWTSRDIAIYFRFDIDQFTAEYNDPNSTVSFTIKRGQLQALATINKAILANAEAGDLPSVNHLEKIRRERAFKTSKLDIFGTFDDEKSFRRVYEYIAEDRTNDLSTGERLFLDLLTIINSFDRQFGKRATVKLLTQQLGFSYDRAVDYYNQADNLFYSNRNTTKDALRNKYAELLEDLAHAAKNAATTPKDYEAVSEIIAKAAKIRKLDEPEIKTAGRNVSVSSARILVDPRSAGASVDKPTGGERPNSTAPHPRGGEEPPSSRSTHRRREHHRTDGKWEIARKLKHRKRRRTRIRSS